MPQPAACAVLILLSANALCDGQVPSLAAQHNTNITLNAERFGAIGDGITDDGPAIQRAVAELCRQDEPATLRFEPGRTYRVKQVDAIRLFRLENCLDITIDGGGSTFLLDGDVRFALIQEARNVRLSDFSIDYDPLPFVDGIITKKNAEQRHVDIRVMDEFSLPPLGGPTHEGGEQAYFGMLWTQGHHSLIGHHFYVLDMQEAYPRSLDHRIVRVFTDCKRFDLIEENVHTISLPVRGIAHRCMDGATIRIAECENVEVENVNVWSAPWFAFQVFRNKGTTTFRHVDIRPKPHSNRRSSSWRDGFHVKGNRADLLFESCHLEGMNDDAFNISTHMSRVAKVVSPTEVQVQQVYPLEIVPFEPGDQITFYSPYNGQITAMAVLYRCDGNQETEYLDNHRPRAPVLTLHLTEPIDDLEPGDRLWNNTSANPNTVIRHCKISNSCRFQSPVTIQECEITAFCWYHSENVEGPIPSRVVIRDSILRLGRGNPALAASFDGSIAMPNRSPTDKLHPAIEYVLLKNNTIDGQVHFARISQLELQGNRFLAPQSKLHFADCESVRLRGNHLGSEQIDNLSQLQIHDPATRAGTAIDNDGKLSDE